MFFDRLASPHSSPQPLPHSTDSSVANSLAAANDRESEEKREPVRTTYISVKTTLNEVKGHETNVGDVTLTSD